MKDMRGFYTIEKKVNSDIEVKTAIILHIGLKKFALYSVPLEIKVK